MRAIAIDFETANSARASACAVGLAVIEDGVLVDTTYHLIRPRPLEFGFYETRVHGLTVADVIDAPEFPAVFMAIRPYLGSHLVLAHNQSFDVAVLKACAELYRLDLPAFDVACTVEMSRVMWPGRGGHKLSDVAGYLGLDFRHHHAHDDAVMAARIALHAASLAGVAGVRDAARRIGVTVRRIDPAAPAPARAQPAPRPATRGGATEVLEFEVAGSTGSRYAVRSGYQAGVFFVRCGCTAGRNGRLCHHVKDLAAGSTEHLLSANVADVSEFARRWTRAGGVLPAPARVGR
jgi:DNA polymerase-3 subunit epsilon